VASHQIQVSSSKKDRVSGSKLLDPAYLISI